MPKKNPDKELQLWMAEYAKTVVPGYTVAPPGPLTERGKHLQKIVLRNDWDALFKLIPVEKWKPTWTLGKYHFVDRPGGRHYRVFTKDALERFVYSPYYTVQPGYTCTDEQRRLGVEAHYKMIRLAAQRPVSDWKRIWPMYPGGGYPGQSYGCEKPQESTWVKIRKPLAIAAGAVAAVTMGPAVLGKLGSMFTGGGAATGAGTGIVGAGTKAGAVAAVTTKAGAGAALAKGTAATVAAAKAAPSLFTSIKGTANNLLDYYNKGTTIKAIASGEIPPPPISIEGDNFLDWATKVAVDEIAKKEQRKLTRKEQLLVNLEMQRLQQELLRRVPSGIPAYPNPAMPIPIQQAMVQEKEKNAENANLMTMGLVGLIVILAARGM